MSADEPEHEAECKRLRAALGICFNCLKQAQLREESSAPCSAESFTDEAMRTAMLALGLDGPEGTRYGPDEVELRREVWTLNAAYAESEREARAAAKMNAVKAAKWDSALSLLCHLLDQILGPRTYDADPANNEDVVNEAILEVRRLRQENARLQESLDDEIDQNRTMRKSSGLDLGEVY